MLAGRNLFFVPLAKLQAAERIFQYCFSPNWAFNIQGLCIHITGLKLPLVGNFEGLGELPTLNNPGVMCPVVHCRTPLGCTEAAISIIFSSSLRWDPLMDLKFWQTVTPPRFARVLFRVLSVSATALQYIICYSRAMSGTEFLSCIWTVSLPRSITSDGGTYSPSSHQITDPKTPQGGARDATFSCAQTLWALSCRSGAGH